MALTRRQREVLDVIRDFIDDRGYSPSLEEIGGALGLSSVATVHKHVTHLVEKGLVRRSWNQNRSIELVQDGPAPEAAEIPLLGTIAAGQPLEAVESPESVAVPMSLVDGRARTFALQVRGDSMIEEHIRDGDLVIIEERKDARNGETVVALIDESDATLKTFFLEGDTVRLQPANHTMDPILVPAGQVRVQGVVVGLIRTF